MCIIPLSANASNLVDALDLSGFVPLILNTMMTVAQGGYDFFVGNGNGIIYILIWGFLAVSLALYLVKMYLPKTWVSFFGFSGGDEMSNGIDGLTIGENLLKPGLRAIIAAVVLLQVRPTLVTKYIIEPFLQFGNIYTEELTKTINPQQTTNVPTGCEQIANDGWISQDACEFLTKPVSSISKANNTVTKRGLEMLVRGLRGLITPIPHGGEDFFNIITGILLIVTFVSFNLFMALLLIQAVFEFGMALILYPFYVLTWVAKPKNSDKWFDVWPAFEGIIQALQKIVITMIACGFMLIINMAIIKALFQWNSSIYDIAAGGSASGNVPMVAPNTHGFGKHALICLSSILTFYVMIRIFNFTKQKITEIAGSGSDQLYKQTVSNTKRHWEDGKNTVHTIGEAVKWKEWFKKK